MGEVKYTYCLCLVKLDHFTQYVCHYRERRVSLEKKMLDSSHLIFLHT